jgi:hypothetical protein
MSRDHGAPLATGLPHCRAVLVAGLPQRRGAFNCWAVLVAGLLHYQPVHTAGTPPRCWASASRTLTAVGGYTARTG